MNIKNTILGLCIFLNFTVNAQANKNYYSEDIDSVTEFTQNKFVVKAKKLSDLKTYNWNIIKEIYKNKPSNTKLEIIVHYDKDGTFEKIDGNDIYQKIGCNVSNLDNTINKLYVFSKKL